MRKLESGSRLFQTSTRFRCAEAGKEKFLTLWKDADQDIPILKQAQAEYARLR